MNSPQHKIGKWLQLAVDQHQAGNLKRAIDYYRRFLRDNPAEAGVLHAVGGLYYQLQNFDKAGEFLEKAYLADPDHPGYLNDLGAFRMQVKDYAGAIELLSKLVAQSNDNAEAFYNLGLAYYGANRLSNAIDAFERVIHLRPDHAATHYYLGATLLGLGQYPVAEESLRKAILHAPGLAAAHHKLGESLSAQRRYASAIESFRKARELDRNNIKVISALAAALHNNGQTQEAIQLLQEELENHPDSFLIMAGLGNLLHISGEIEKAEQFYREALSKKQHSSAACFALANIRRFCHDDQDIIDHMQSLLKNESLSDDERKNICFALGKIYDDCAEYDSAFENYRVANLISKQSVSYNRAGRQQLISETISVFNNNFFSELVGLGTEKERPVFIVGMPRSGTTLTEQILSAHPEIAGGDELLYFASIRKLLPSLLKRDEAYPLCCPFLDSQNAEDIIRHYLALLERHSETARFVTDKLPDNYLYLGLIRVLFPNAPIIHCRRNPLDVCLSNYFQSFHTGLDYSFDLMDTGHHYLQYSRLMAHWRRVLPGAFLEIRYEDLVTDLEKNGRKLIEFCGLEWHEDCLQFHEQKRDIRTASFWQVRQPIYKSSVGRWKNYESQLEPLMQLFAQAEDEL